MYVELDAFKQWANIESDGYDTELIAVLEAASAAVDGYCSRSFGSTGTPEERVFRSGVDPTVLSVDDFYGDTPTVTIDGTPVDVMVDPAPAGRPSSVLLGMFGRNRLVHVTATWGWEMIPEPVKLATKLVANKLWTRRDSPYGTQGNVEIGFVRVTGLDRDVEQLLGPFVHWPAAIA